MLRLLTAAIGTFETSIDVHYTAAFGGNPDIGPTSPRSEFDPGTRKAMVVDGS